MAVEAAASAVAVDPSPQPADFGRLPSSAETIKSSHVITDDNSFIEADQASDGRDICIVGRSEPGSDARRDEDIVGGRGQQVEEPGDNIAVAAVAAAFPTAVDATGPPPWLDIAGGVEHADEGEDQVETVQSKPAKRGQVPSSAIAANNAQRHHEEGEGVFAKQLGQVEDRRSADARLGCVDQSQSLDGGIEPGPYPVLNVADSDEKGLDATTQATNHEDGRATQEEVDGARGLEANQGEATDGDGSVSAEARSGKEWANDERHREGDSESEEEGEDNDNDNEDGEEGREGDDEEAAKTDEEMRCDLETAIDSLQLLLVRR